MAFSIAFFFLLVKVGLFDLILTMGLAKACAVFARRNPMRNGTNTDTTLVAKKSRTADTSAMRTYLIMLMTVARSFMYLSLSFKSRLL